MIADPEIFIPTGPPPWLDSEPSPLELQPEIETVAGAETLQAMLLISLRYHDHRIDDLVADLVECSDVRTVGRVAELVGDDGIFDVCEFWKLSNNTH